MSVSCHWTLHSLRNVLFISMSPEPIPVPGLLYLVNSCVLNFFIIKCRSYRNSHEWKKLRTGMTLEKVREVVVAVSLKDWIGFELTEKKWENILSRKWNGQHMMTRKDRTHSEPFKTTYFTNILRIMLKKLLL